VITDSELALAAAQAGAAVVRAHYGGALTRIEKADGDFATTADLEAEHAIVRVLRTARPADAVVGEESGRTGADGAGRVWLVDPLCGTLNFAVRSMLVSVNVAPRTASGVAVAASADPFTDEVFWTDGVRAWVRHQGIDERLTPSGDSALVDVNLDRPRTRRRTPAW
jgi:myo-inositol-1(or 4)-monophosphatase